MIATFPDRAEPEGRMLLHLGNVIKMLPLATHCHTHYHVYPFHFVLFKFKDLVAKQHPTTTVEFEETKYYNCILCSYNIDSSIIIASRHMQYSTAYYKQSKTRARENLGMRLVHAPRALFCLKPVIVQCTSGSRGLKRECKCDCVKY